VKVLVIATLLAGCGTDPKAIDLAIPGTQVLVTEKVNGGAWKKLAGQFDGDANKTTYAIEIGDEYELAVVCIRSGPRDAGQFVAAEVFGTSDDPEVTLGSWEPPNCLLSPNSGPDPIGPRVTISGTFDEDMDIALGSKSAHVTAGHLFAFSADTGRHDLIAYSNTKMLIQRDLPIDADTTLTPVHVTRDGTTLLAVAVTLSGDADEGFPSVIELIRTGNRTTFYWLNEDLAGALFIPIAMLAPGDEQHFMVQWYAGTTSRGLDLGDPTRLADATLLPRIASATRHDGIGATWEPISEFFTSATVGTYTDASEQRVTASKLWLDRHGKSALDFDATVAGYDPSWTVAAPLKVTLTRWSPALSAYTASDPPEPM